MPWASYEYARGCIGRSEPGAVALMSWINRNYPKSKNWGVYACKSLSSGWSIHAEGRALDVGYALVDGKANPDGYRLFSHLQSRALQLGIQGIIWDRKIWTNRGDARPYTSGGNNVTLAHVDHLHIELTRNAAKTLTPVKIGQIMGTPPAPGSVATGTAGGTDVTGLVSGLQDLTSKETWTRVAMFLGGAILVILALVAFQSGNVRRVLSGDVAKAVQKGYKAVKK